MLANSAPMAPAPRMMSDSGTRFRLRISSLVKTFLPSISTPGMERGVEPVAITVFLAATSAISLPPAVTAIFPLPASRPVPVITFTSFFFMRNSIPLALPCTTRFFRLRTAEMST
jgi:hypothetical protein